jgi:hypothetical protein
MSSMSAAVLVSGARTSRRHRCVVAVCALAFALAGGLALGASVARAGQWAQVSCENPGNGSASNAEGWTQQIDGTPGTASSQGTNSVQCGANAPINDVLVANGSGTVAVATIIQYTYGAPANSTLVGGTISGSLSAWGQGGLGVIYSPADSMDAGDEVALCQEGGGCPGAGEQSQSATWSLPAQDGGGVYIQAACNYNGGCSNGEGNTVATATINWAEMLLDNDASPGISGQPSGTALGTVSGTGQLLFTATDPDGPGVYNVTVSIDGTAVYSATPNSNGGECAQHGIYPGTSALMFDGAQPCPQSTSVDASVPTTGFSNGTHTLTAVVTDAAGNSSTVVAQTITVDNASPTAPSSPTAPTTPTSTVTPAAPAALRKIHDKLIVGWDYRQARTRLALMRIARKAKLPATGRVSFACVPAADCPKLKLKHPWVGIKHAIRLFSALQGLRFRQGDVVQITISAPHRKAERFDFHIHRSRAPGARVYSGKSRLPGGTTLKKKRK